MKTLFLYGSPEHYANYIRAFAQLNTNVLATKEEHRAAECDGLILPGGGDIHPSLYGRSCSGSHEADPEQDNADFRIAARFLALERPILGICRGMQVLNVIFGGTLHQDIPGHGAICKRDRVHLTHTTDPLLQKIYGTRFPVNSAHHQAIEQLGHGLEAIQWSQDGCIEAVRHGKRPVWAVQWHPERACFTQSRPDTVDGSAYLDAFVHLL